MSSLRGSGRPREAARALLAVALVGIGAGLAGLSVTLVLHLVQHLAYGYADGPFLDGAEHAPAAVRVLALTGAGVIGAVGWWALRRRRSRTVEVADALGGASMPPGPTAARVGLQVVIVGLGASIGREAAPRLLGGLLAQEIADRLRLSPALRRLLIAAGAGAGLAAVYDVPLGGALFTLEVLLGEFSGPAALVAVTTAAIATLVARPVVPDAPLYVPLTASSTPSLLLFAAAAGPLLGVGALVFDRLLTIARTRRANGAWLLLVMPVVFAAVGLVGVVWPELLGNGRALGQVAFSLAAPAAVLALLAALKALLTAATVAAGAEGGTLTPSIAIGAAAGAAAASLWAFLQPGLPLASAAVVGAAVVLSVTMRAPVTAVVLAIEFTGSNLSLALPVLIGVALASITRRALARTGTSRTAREY